MTTLIDSKVRLWDPSLHNALGGTPIRVHGLAS
jgi:hypothetical protein